MTFGIVERHGILSRGRRFLLCSLSLSLFAYSVFVYIWVESSSSSSSSSFGDAARSRVCFVERRFFGNGGPEGVGSASMYGACFGFVYVCLLSSVLLYGRGIIVSWHCLWVDEGMYAGEEAMKRAGCSNSRSTSKSFRIC